VLELLTSTIGFADTSPIEVANADSSQCSSERKLRRTIPAGEVLPACD